MKFVEKASGWMIAIGLAIAVLLAFNYLDVFVLVGFRNAGIDTKIYRGVYSATAALLNTVLFGALFIVCKKIKRPILKAKKIGFFDVMLLLIVAAGMLGFVETFIYVSDNIAEYIKSISEQMTEYRNSVDRYTGISRDAVPLWDTVLYLITLCFIVPLEEELIFRGAIFGVLREKMKPSAAVLISALLFGVMHRVSVHTIYAVVCGMILSACYYYTESIFASITIHSVFNIVGSGLGELLKIKELGVPAVVRNEVLNNANAVCIVAMVPAAIAFLILRHNAKKSRQEQAGSVAVSE